MNMGRIRIRIIIASETEAFKLGRLLLRFRAAYKGLKVPAITAAQKIG
jgi:hypothetical protein